MVFWGFLSRESTQFISLWDIFTLISKVNIFLEYLSYTKCPIFIPLLPHREPQQVCKRTASFSKIHQRNYDFSTTVKSKVNAVARSAGLNEDRWKMKRANKFLLWWKVNWDVTLQLQGTLQTKLLKRKSQEPLGWGRTRHLTLSSDLIHQLIQFSIQFYHRFSPKTSSLLRISPSAHSPLCALFYHRPHFMSSHSLSFNL